MKCLHIKIETLNSQHTLLCLIVGGVELKGGVAEISNFHKMGGGRSI